MRLSITTAAFVLASMVHGTLIRPYNATADAAIHLYTFATTDCQGNPQESPFEMKNGQCVNLRDPLSAKPALWKGHRSDYIEEINNLHAYCKLELFGTDDCQSHSRVPDYHDEVTEESPGNFNKCLMPIKAAGAINPSFIKSAKFSCVPVENPNHLCTRTIRLTSWSIEPTYGNPVPVVHKATLTGTLQVGATQEAVRTLVKRKNQPGKGVWMLHPWSLTWLCYSCFLKQVEYTGRMECLSGIDYPIHCSSPMPSPYSTAVTHSTTTTSTSTTTVTTHPSSTAKATSWVIVTDSDSDDERDNLHLSMKRSWHTPVWFDHPFQVGKKACADAEWEKRSQKHNYIKIQNVHICDNNDRSDSRWIGLPPTDVHTIDATKTSTRTIGHTTTATSTHTLRHDQL
ncbi:hypothetical protein E8E11_010854 [Didymella keratinophila]|nr:hypothetical protein E8E11_010854 [Didymella keratinophila]